MIILIWKNNVETMKYLIERQKSVKNALTGFIKRTSYYRGSENKKNNKSKKYVHESCIKSQTSRKKLD